MPRYIVTYTSMIIEADSAEHAIERVDEAGGGGNWEAELVDAIKTPAEVARWVLASHDVASVRDLNSIDEVTTMIAEGIDAYRQQAGIEVELWHAEHDGVRVVQIDTPQDGRIRINLNDAPIWDGDPATDERPGAHFHDVWDDEDQRIIRKYNDDEGL